MLSHDELVSLARSIARAENDKSARRWLGAVASILADWGGAQAASLLKESLPAQCFSGAGTKGQSWAEAEKTAGGDASVALINEAGERSRQPDPRNAAMTCLPLIGLFKEQVAKERGPQAVDALLAAMPAPLQVVLRAASTTPSYAYRLIPQSYARPHR